MKRFLYGMCFTCALLPSVFAESSLKTEEDKLSYSIGADLGKSFKSQGIKIHSDSFMQGFSTALSGQSLVLSQDEMRETLQNFQKKLLMKRIAQYKEKATINKEKGQKFLEENKTKEGVKTTESGLQYKVLEKGEGKESPTKEDSVTVEYTGKLLDGKVFDTTDGKDKPATFKVTQVIPGWTEVLQLMKPGDKWEVYIPSDLAYGPRGIGGPIGPNETLIFTIKLISVDKDKSAKANDAK